MSNRIKRTQFYFLIIAVLSLFVILLSFKWKISETVFKISSEISQVKIANIHLSGINLTEPIRYIASRTAINVSKSSPTKNFSRTRNESLNVDRGHLVQEEMKINNVTYTTVWSYENTSDRGQGDTIWRIKTTKQTYSKLRSGSKDKFSKSKQFIDSNQSKTVKQTDETRDSFGDNMSVKNSGNDTEEVLDGKTTNTDFVPNLPASNTRYNTDNVVRHAKTNDTKLNDLKQNVTEMVHFADILLYDKVTVTVKNLKDHETPAIQTEQDNQTFTEKQWKEIMGKFEEIRKRHEVWERKTKGNKLSFATDVPAENVDVGRDIMVFKQVRNELRHLGVRGKYGNSLTHVHASKTGTHASKSGTLDRNDSEPETTARPDRCQGCFRTNFQKIINEPELCKGNVEILILVVSAISNSDSRDAIRSTWCKRCNANGSSMKQVFILGNKNDTVENERLLEESRLNHDIIQMDLYDVYANLTLKTMAGLQWSKDHCKNAKYVMKTDDDMFVNTELLTVMLKSVPSKKFLGGRCWGPSSPHRDKSSKWFVSFNQYQHSYFPSMCSGTGYIMSRDVVAGILQQSPNVPFFHLEDVYVAICVSKLGIHPKLIYAFNNVLVSFDACTYRSQIVTSHEFSADSLRYIWKQMMTCPRSYVRPAEIYSAVAV